MKPIARMLTALIALIAIAVPNVSYAQQYCPNCPGNVCPSFDVQVKPLEELGFTFGNKDWRESAARAMLGNGCGSASLCGVDNGKSYLLTNAHVAGTKVGVDVKLRMQHGERTVEYTGRVVMAAYSSRYQTDWALLMVEGEIPAMPRPLSKEKPNPSRNYVTHGSPRCVWPQATQYLRNHNIDANMPFWTWLPNSIGGQSGSGVWDVESGIQYGLLTWSSNGRGAGQQTAEIYRQARQQTNVGEKMPDGVTPATAAAGITLEEGFFAETGITDMPIWAGEKPDVEPEPDPNPTDPTLLELTERERATLLQFRLKAREQGVDWILWIQILLQLLDALKR